MQTDLEDGRTVDVEITGSPSNKKRIDVCVEGGPRWVFAVEDRTAGLIELHGEGYTDEIPTWLEPMLQRIGLEGIEA
ncbi:hypothetical protein CP557_02265 [Natrinema ejinorense]|uniref:Uncharacterized protein n=1 Tax=Natrinema ejinorense TaxID=373386 RepID=A0A2A5R0J3_9EURY|nr:hypothetical protein CP557_02265 [Natrinema ejinorense]